jgi:hypothetical protein
MTYSALEVATWTRSAIDALKPLYSSDTKLFETLATMSGLSRTHIASFSRDPEYSITVSRLDRLAAAVNILTRQFMKELEATVRSKAGS